MKISQGMLDQISKDLTDKGLLIEAGWVGLRHLAMPEDAPKEQLQDLKTAFFAGAQHLFSSILSILEHEQGVEPTGNDMRRMQQIHEELAKFEKEIKLRAMPTGGSA